jgi:hypothetical protein
LKKFAINDADLKAKIFLELGGLNLIQLRFDKAQNFFYESLLIYEKLSWKFEIGYCLC